MAKIKFESDEQLNEWANEIQKAIADLKEALNEMRIEIENIKSKKKGTGFFD